MGSAVPADELSLSTDALSLADVLASLSYALDLTSGQPMGHAQRSCLIGLRIAQELRFDPETMSALYYALLMKDSGCSSNAARMVEIFGGDDIKAKQLSKVTDWSNLADAVKYAAASAVPTGSLIARAARLLKIAANPGTSDILMHARCTRGARIALSIGLGEPAAECIQHLDEHWDGHGGPNHLKGEEISLLGRIACISQTLEVFTKTFDVATGYEVIRKRSGRWFDPDIVRAACAFEHDANFWRSLHETTREALLNLEIKATAEKAGEERIDAICDAFAQIVDAKSPFTAEHSSRVRDYAVVLGQAYGMTGTRIKTLRRAALLHDIGKLSVSNTILDKNGKPTDDEWLSIRRHPYYTQQILAQINGLERLTDIAAAHHERLDGTGYFRGLEAKDLDTDMRILAASDVFDALSANRPYRGALVLTDVYAIMDKDAGKALDGECISLLKEAYPHSVSDLPVTRLLRAGTGFPLPLLSEGETRERRSA